MLPSRCSQPPWRNMLVNTARTGCDRQSPALSAATSVRGHEAAGLERGPRAPRRRRVVTTTSSHAERPRSRRRSAPASRPACRGSGWRRGAGAPAAASGGSGAGAVTAWACFGVGFGRLGRASASRGGLRRPTATRRRRGRRRPAPATSAVEPGARDPPQRVAARRRPAPGSTIMPWRSVQPASPPASRYCATYLPSALLNATTRWFVRVEGVERARARLARTSRRAGRATTSSV